MEPLLALRVHRSLFRAALSGAGLFSWLIVFAALSEKGVEEALVGTVGLYAISRMITFVMSPLAGMSLRHGVRRSLVYGSLAAAAAFTMTLAMLQAADTSTVFDLAAAFAVLYGIYRALYWIPYRTASIQASASIEDILIACMPLAVGVAFLTTHASWLAITACIFGIIASILTILRISDHPEPYEWNYADSFRELVNGRNSDIIGIFILDGIHGTALVLLWPLAIFLLIGFSFPLMGALITIALLLAMIGRRLFAQVGRFLAARPLLALTATTSTWVLRIVASSPVHFVIIDSAHHTVWTPRRHGIDLPTHEQSADAGHYIDEFSVVKEMGLAIGSFILCCLVIFVAYMTTEALAFGAAFIAAAAASAWSHLLVHRIKRKLA